MGAERAPRRRAPPFAWSARATLAAALLLATAGCNPVDDRLWPPIRPESQRSAPTAEASPFLRALPENVWELAGGLSLLLGVGAAGFLYWRFPGLLDEYSSLRAQTLRLHDRRDRTVVDLAQMGRNLRDLEQEIAILRRELARRTEAAALASPPAPAPAPAQTAGPVEPPRPELPFLNPSPRAAHGRPRSAGSASWQFVEPVLEGPATHASRSVLHERPAAVPATPIPATAAPAEPLSVPTASPADQAPREAAALDALIAAVNSRGRSPIAGVTCVELDIAPAPESGTGLEPIATRLRMVSRDGRFLLVMVDGDAWLFPTIESLEQFDQRQAAEGIFLAHPERIDRPQLLLPAMLREVGGLWEVTDPGKILVPRG
ncbi:MAG: hypothetical protein VKJ05_05960 [Synechococcaceae cyanobacterium]|nr:hypothetical protein [Synechococcaceae cyanobacterium]